MALQDKDYLAATLIGEARGEPIEGIIAVANVIRHRAYSERKNYKEVCLEPLQFSCWNDDDPNNKLVRAFLSNLDAGNTIIDPYYRQCIVVADAVYNGDFVDNVNGAKNYVTMQRYQIAKARQDSKLDGWILKLKETGRYGHHVFLSA